MNDKIYKKTDDSNSKTNFFLNGISTIIICAIFCITVLILLSGCGKRKGIGTVLGTITVDAGDYDRINTPIHYHCRTTDIFGDPKKFRREGFFHYIDEAADLSLLRDNHLVLIEEGGAKSRINAQWDLEVNFDWEQLGDGRWENVTGKGALVWLLEGKTQKGTKRLFKLVLEPGIAPSSPFTIEEDIKKKNLLVKYKDCSVLRYNYGIVQQTEGNSGLYDRAGYIHPVWTPSGKIITGDFSPEHIMQRGIFFAWKNIMVDKKEIGGFWELGEEPGRILPDRFGPSIIRGPVFTDVVVFNKGDVKGKIYFKEFCVIKIYGLPEENVWLFDMYILQEPVNPERPVVRPTETTTATVIVKGKVMRITEEQPKGTISMTIPKFQYGGIAFRGVSDWLSKDVSLEVLTSEGKNRMNADSTQARWIDYSGPVEKEWGGITIFDHPLNQRYPTPLRVHPELPYFCYAFVQNEPYVISSESTLGLIYRFLVHNGHPNKELNERFAQDFVNPPEILWEPIE